MKPRIILNHATLLVLACLIVAIGGVGAWVLLRGSSHTDNASVAADASKDDAKSATQRITVAAMGDMLAHDTIIDNAKTDSGYDFAHFFKNVRPLYTDADIVFCNQEGLSSGPEYGISGYPAFNAPTEFSKGLKTGAGCNFINLANNHMGDKGTEATNETIRQWNGLKPLVLSGTNESAEQQRVVRKTTIKGVSVSLVSFADFNNNTATPAYSVNNYHDEVLVRSLVAEARTASDVVIASMHWGTEDSAEVNADQAAQVNLLASLGVDVIIGTGPHVLQKEEMVTRPDSKKMLVWYSLGNFLSSQLTSDQLFSGVARFDIVKGSDGVTIENPRFQPTYMHYDWSADDARAGNYGARKNAMLYPLKDADKYVAASQLATTPAAQREYMTKTLGPGVKIEN